MIKDPFLLQILIQIVTVDYFCIHCTLEIEELYSFVLKLTLKQQIALLNFENPAYVIFRAP